MLLILCSCSSFQDQAQVNTWDQEISLTDTKESSTTHWVAAYIDYDEYTMWQSDYLLKREIIEQFNAQQLVVSDFDTLDTSEAWRNPPLYPLSQTWWYFPPQHLDEIRCDTFLKTSMTQSYFFFRAISIREYTPDEVFSPMYCNTLQLWDFTLLYYFSLTLDASAYLTHRYDIYLFHKDGFFRWLNIGSLDFPYEYWTLDLPFYWEAWIDEDGVGYIESFDWDIIVKDPIILSRFHNWDLKEFFQDFELKVFDKAFESHP